MIVVDQHITAGLILSLAEHAFRQKRSNSLFTITSGKH